MNRFSVPPPMIMNRQRFSGPHHRGPTPPNTLPYPQQPGSGCPWQMPPQWLPGFNSQRPPPSFNHQPRGPPANYFQTDNIFASGPPGNSCDSFPFAPPPNNNSMRGCQNGPSPRGNFRGRGRGHNLGQSHNQGHGPSQGQSRGGGIHGLNGQQTKRQKEKVDKRDLAENNVFYCDICDRGSKTEQKHKEHVDGHIKCSYKDCPFIAAPKLVQLHLTMQHRSGMAKKVWSLESEEDIRKWQGDRKRNYPSADNIAKKQELMKDKAARGELIQTKDFSKVRGRGRGRGRHRGRGGRGKWRHYDQQEPDMMRQDMTSASNKEEDDDDAPEEVKTVKSTVQDEPEHTSTVNTEETTPAGDESRATANGLSLLSSYGDLSTDGEEEQELKDVSDNNTRKPPNVSTEHDDHNISKDNDISADPLGSIVNTATATMSTAASSDSSVSKTETPSLPKLHSSHHKTHPSMNTPVNVQYNPQNKHSSSEITDSPSKNPVKNEDRKRIRQEEGGKSTVPSKKARTPQHKKPPRRNYTLLEKLLATDIRRERNKILQCIHFVVKNKFFME